MIVLCGKSTLVCLVRTCSLAHARKACDVAVGGMGSMKRPLRRQRCAEYGMPVELRIPTHSCTHPPHAFDHAAITTRTRHAYSRGAAGLRSVNEGESVVVYATRDRSPLLLRRRVRDTWVVSDVQPYLDLSVSQSGGKSRSATCVPNACAIELRTPFEAYPGVLLLCDEAETRGRLHPTPSTANGRSSRCCWAAFARGSEASTSPAAWCRGISSTAPPVAPPMATAKRRGCHRRTMQISLRRLREEQSTTLPVDAYHCLSHVLRLPPVRAYRHATLWAKGAITCSAARS